MINEKKKMTKTKQSKICMATGNIYKTIIQFSDYIISFGFKKKKKYIHECSHIWCGVGVDQDGKHRAPTTKCKKDRNNANVP